MPHIKKMNSLQNEGQISLSINLVYISKFSVDSKLHEYFENEPKFTKTFKLYFKLHSTTRHYKSHVFGKLVSKEVFNSLRNRDAIELT